MKFINFPIFLTSLSLGLFLVYISMPPTQVIYVYPNPNNVEILNKIGLSEVSFICSENGECVSRSYLGVAVSDDVEGPYEDLGLIVTSGHVGDENPGINGENYDGNIHPNAIDPDVFFDKEGRLWMVYGSYSGGIWIMEMDPQTGKALPDQGYGTKLMGGFYSAIEGPNMLYSPESDYYYLFTSFGGFNNADGYNMRIARSRNPDGPFEDIKGQDMIGAAGAWSAIEGYGNKIMGGHLYDVNPGEAGSDHGYMSPGHNSVYFDESTGQYFVIFHTRFPGTGEIHNVRVHEMFVNEEISRMVEHDSEATAA